MGPLAAALGLHAADIATDRLPPQVVFTGAYHLIVPKRDREAVDRIIPNAKALLAILSAAKADGCYVFSLDPPHANAAGGWTVAVNPDRGVISASHEVLGPILIDASFDEPGQWFTEVVEPDRLVLRDTHSRTGWVFELKPDTLVISSTNRNARLHATIPAPHGLVPARLLDPQGTPVNWVGNDEIEGYTAAGNATESFLPSMNPDVIYFSLGRMTSPAFHSLFDRQTDAAIDFPLGSTLEQTLPARIGYASRCLSQQRSDPSQS